MVHHRIFCLLLCICMLCAAVSPYVSAKSGVEAFVYTYTDSDPIVDTQTVFLSAFDTEKDIEIQGERASWYFFYDNIHLSINTWSLFSTAVTVKPIDNAHIAEVLSGTAAYYVDMADGNTYPGPAEVTIPVSDVTEGTTFHLYRYEEDPSGVPALTPIARDLTLDENGAFTVTVTAALDFLLVPASISYEAMEGFFIISPIYGAESFLSTDSFPKTVLLIVIALAVILFAVYAVTVKVLKAKRKKRMGATRHD